MHKTCTAVFRQLHGSREAYYTHWYHEKPMAITSARREELRILHRIIYKCIEYMALHYRELVPQYMPLSDQEMEVLEIQSRVPFRAGTYRPDYLISEKGDILICEITSRFFAHGIFMSYYSERAADVFLKKTASRNNGQEEATTVPEEVPSPQFPRRDSTFEQMLRYMLEITGNKKEIYILKSADRTSEIGLYVPFYEYYGKKAVILEAAEVEDNVSRWRNGFVISALNQKDLLSFSMETIEAMVGAGMYNDLRTILLVHDKRFMRLWFEDEFTGRFLTGEETAFLRKHTIPTWLYPDESADPRCSEETEAVWRDARRSRENYILKHHRLGKSEQVYAGPLTDERTWQGLWEAGTVRQMILQPFIRQRTYPTVWEGKRFEDYICGMMLCADDRYFDSGMFRASSLPVTNVGDDRKICPIHTDDMRIIQFADVL